MKRTRKSCLITLLAVLLAAPGVRAQVRHTAQDSIRAEKIMQHLKLKRELTSGEMMVEAASQMLGTPYVGGTLDRPGKETLTVSLTQTDCIIFVETCLNLVLSAQRGDEEFGDLCGRILESRYRNGVARAYADRIHYTTEWIRKGEARNILEDITPYLGGVTYDNHPINFMGTHPEKYPLMNDPEAIRAVEKELNKIPITYIPKEEIRRIEMEILPGDIICYVTSVAGLDISHVAIAHMHDGKVGFIHASSIAKKVIVDPKSIAEYAASQKSCVGIKIVRLKEIDGPEKHTFRFDGRDRDYWLFVPEQAPEGCPLVMVLHGYGQQAKGYVPEMIDLARKEGFAVCYPAGRPNARGKAGWNVRYTPQQADVSGDDDVALLTFLARELQRQYGFNPRGTFLTGMSNGGDMCYLMAYEKDSPFAAFASVAGQTMKWLSDTSAPGRAVPFMEIHGTADTSARWDGDIHNAGGWGAYLSVPDGTGILIRKNGCQEERITKLPLKKPGARQVYLYRYGDGVPAWKGGPACEVRIFKIIGGTHSWGLADLDTCREIWNFFKMYLR